MGSTLYGFYPSWVRPLMGIICGKHIYSLKVNGTVVLRDWFFVLKFYLWKEILMH